MDLRLTFWKPKRKVWFQKNDDSKIGNKWELKRVKLNKNKIQRWVRKNEMGEYEMKYCPSGVDDPYSSWVKYPKKYPQQARGHKEYLERYEKGEIEIE